MASSQLLSPSRASRAFRALRAVYKSSRPILRSLTQVTMPVYVPDQLFADEGRWLYNEEQQWSMRRLRFDPDALIEAAEGVTKDAKCVLLERLAEGISNRCFRMKFNDGTQMVARLPFPISGPPHLTTASEVATMDYCRTILDLPVPKVHAWCSHASQTPVGSEYIIMDFIPGVPLGTRYFMGLGKDPVDTITGLVQIDATCGQQRFAQYGCLYYKEDVSPELQQRPLYRPDADDDAGSERFRIGSSVERCFWLGGRAAMDLDRGPWLTAESRATAIASASRAWISQYAKPFPEGHPRYRSGGQNVPDAHLKLIDQFLALAPLLIYTMEPPEDFDIRIPCFRHPDLHGENIIVDPTGFPTVNGIIDWQSTCIAPIYEQSHHLLPMVEWSDYDDVWVKSPSSPIAKPEKPDTQSLEYIALSDAQKTEILRRYQGAALSQIYNIIASQNNSNLFVAHHALGRVSLVEALKWLPASWDDHGLAALREALIWVWKGWPVTAPEGVPCPIHFTEVELEAHSAEYPLIKSKAFRWEALRTEIGMVGEGWVKTENYEAAQARNKQLLAEALSQAKDDAERAEIRQTWPFQDDAHSASAGSCWESDAHARTPL